MNARRPGALAELWIKALASVRIIAPDAGPQPARVDAEPYGQCIERERGDEIVYTFEGAGIS